MDFFEHQEQARRKSHVLVFYFLLAVIGIVVSIYAVIVAAGFFAGREDIRRGGSGLGIGLWNPELFLGTAAATTGVILLGTAYKTLRLTAGGAVVAKDLGGRPLDPNTTDYHEKRLLNVVEEMAIASGVPVPEVYVMDDEDAINAFAAGRSTSDAVIGVTRGCMKLLSRDELQGVIAHEFSHILNGDMRLNLRLIGLLFGILFIAMIGQMLVRGTLRGARFSRSKEGGGGALAFLLFGVALMLVGYVGLFFGKLIKAAVSRQREFLADASAVQFTRNPDGIAGALKKIGGLSHGSSLKTPMAEEASHMFFGNALRGGLSLATHPPLTERIRRIVPSWDGKFPKPLLPNISTGARDVEAEASRHRAAVAAGAVSGFSGGEDTPAPPAKDSALTLSEAEALDGMGHLRGEHVAYGRELRGGMPEHWVRAAHSESGAQALVFALLLAQDDDLRGVELSQLRSVTDEETYLATVQLHREIANIHSALKLALVDLALPSLRHLSPDEYQRLRHIVGQLMASDRKIDLFEFTLQKVIRRHLDNYFGHVDPLRIRFKKIGDLEEDAAVLLTTLAFLGHADDPDAAHAAFRHGAREIESDTYATLAPKPAAECGLDRVEAAIDRFSQGTPLLKRRLLHACGKTVMADEKVTSAEAELIRAIADAIGFPIPPFVKTGAAAAA
ncbi:MAG: M48 family metallopeptidase [Verrucomicrobiae bacterium]|nr:M48 family metallopeptidase [Verrucomicrobiae bacterium]MCP5538768.1 M48 family metallopeptidase [Akkermansiaceae bacterium]MCP5549524.1 M48 family metallopeptidase [Akkermansiaceae bacterium]